ncbi:transporter substrate-binding domain-containing protein [Mycobacterium sp. NPDC006124]|uniref:transporter substrate-binding domain-containing protein n=1 Tax=Mycobacterium sp. NPDC006124 TaxID=3156729 RepID=UPI0033A944C5
MGRRGWLVAVILTALVAVVGGCSGTPQQAPTAGVPTDVARDGTLRVCSTGDYRPFTYRAPDGTWSGFDVDAAGDMAHDLGVRLEMVPTTWKTLVSDVAAKCDIAMGGISVSPERAKLARFTTPYLTDGKAAIARCVDANRFHDLDDVDQPGVRVIVNPGGGNAAFDEAHLHRASVVPWPDNNTIFDRLASGGADLMITDVSEIRWQTTQNAQLCGVALDRPFTSEQKAYLLPKDSEDLVRWTDHWLATHDGEYAALRQKYFGGP